MGCTTKIAKISVSSDFISHRLYVFCLTQNSQKNNRNGPYLRLHLAMPTIPNTNPPPDILSPLETKSDEYIPTHRFM